MRVLLNPPEEALGRANAILTTTAARHVRAFVGSLSIKWMAAGWATWETSAGVYRVEPDCYMVLNHGSTYSLAIEADEPTEAFCPFFAAGFVEDVHRALVLSDRALLDDPDTSGQWPETTFPEHILPADDDVTPLLRRLRDGVRAGGASDGWVEDGFHGLAAAVLRARRDVRRQIARVPAVRAATRDELYRRLCRGRDFIHAHYAERLTLAEIAAAAWLAPSHFHRLFRAAFARSPHDYVVRLRLERAKTLLRATERPVSEICLDVGFESLGSFSSLFRRECGVPPTVFRRRARAD